MPGSQASGNTEEMLGRDYTIRDDLFRRKYIVKGGGGWKGISTLGPGNAEPGDSDWSGTLGQGGRCSPCAVESMHSTQ